MKESRLLYANFVNKRFSQINHVCFRKFYSSSICKVNMNWGILFVFERKISFHFWLNNQIVHLNCKICGNGSSFLQKSQTKLFRLYYFYFCLLYSSQRRQNIIDVLSVHLKNLLSQMSKYKETNQNSRTKRNRAKSLKF